MNVFLIGTIAFIMELMKNRSLISREGYLGQSWQIWKIQLWSEK